MVRRGFRKLVDPPEPPDRGSGQAHQLGDHDVIELAEKTAKAKGKTPIKGRVRKTIYIDTTLVDKIDASAQEAEIGISDFYNVLLESAFAAWHRGEIEVEYTEEVVVKRGIKVRRP